MDHSTGIIDVTENHQRKSFPVSGFPFPVNNSLMRETGNGKRIIYEN